MSRNPQLASLGVNAVGYLRGGLGLGQAARLYVRALHAAGVPVRTTTVDVNLPDVVGPDGRRAQVKTTDFADLHVEGELPFNLVCVNAPELPALHASLGADFFEDRYTIGVWAWEVDVVPSSWDRAFGLVDEIWVYSRYVQEIISNVSPVPVVRIPLPIVAPPAGGDLTGLHLPDGFQFLFLFDFYSTLQRKNPLGLVAAFTRAFEPGEGPQLVLKSHNGDYKPERLAALRDAVGDRPDIQIVDEFLSSEQMAALMRRADCYVSLHRAEGFGLTLGETMALGKPVIATGFSANLDFMTAENSYLVRHRETLVGPEGENYPAHGTWAEPDVEHAAQLMREVWEDPAGARARGERGQREIAEHFSLEAVGQVARERLKRLAAGHRRRGPASADGGRDGDDGGLANSWVETAELKLTFDPLRDAREIGGPKGAVRRAALAAMRPYTHHQDELSRFTVRALREVDGRLDDLTLDTQAQVARLQALVQRLEAGLAGDLTLVAEGMRARPASTHPAISQTDEHGRRVLRFDGASSDAATYRGFEDIFRGDERAVLQQQLAYLPHFDGADWVLDLGCGRGEFLDALVAREIGARGADMDASMVARCREKGHDVQLADAATYLRALDDGSVPAIFAAQVVEHLGADELTELLALMQAKLAPGGVAIMETVNPHNPAALKAFWTDTTHHHPLFPEVLLALCRLAGFESGEVRFPQESENFDADVYVNRDYAVIVRAAPAAT
ncbi:MAG: methyltransferase domain-containing protein [Solirubrobacteraceae bacterium]|nr:methyltransferase domain-containing protein [Solirubrobacteraceae bacterium]